MYLGESGYYVAEIRSTSQRVTCILLSIWVVTVCHVLNNMEYFYSVSFVRTAINMGYREGDSSQWVANTLSISMPPIPSAKDIVKTFLERCEGISETMAAYQVSVEIHSGEVGKVILI